MSVDKTFDLTAGVYFYDLDYIFKHHFFLSSSTHRILVTHPLALSARKSTFYARQSPYDMPRLTVYTTPPVIIFYVLEFYRPGWHTVGYGIHRTPGDKVGGR